MTVKQFNPSISIIRVIAMLSIILGHWMTMKGINHYQLGAIGVQIFLFIFGWLQSGKQITNTRKWLFDKWKRIMIPYYIVLGIVVAIRCVCRFEVRLSALFVMLFNLQGSSHLLKNVSLPIVAGYGQTWFLTVLVICYLLTLLIKRHPKIEQWISSHIVAVFIYAVIMQMVLAFGYIQIGGILCYFIGYLWNHENYAPQKAYGYLTVSMILITIIRFIVHSFFDGTQFYDSIVFTWSFNVLGIWLTITMMIICDKFKDYSTSIATSKLWMLLDLLSYPLFLSHYMFMQGELSVKHWLTSSFSQAIVFSFLTIVVALNVLSVSDFGRLKKLCCKNERMAS